MAEFPALPLWTDAYLGDTTHLTTFEHGAYLLLLIVSWRSPGGRLPDDDALLARYARMTRDKWRKCRPILEPFFRIENGFWMQARLQDELQHLQSRREKQREAGVASAVAKSLKRKNRASTNVGETLQRNGNERPTPIPIPISSNIDTSNEVSSESPLDPQEIVDSWNIIAERRGLARVVKLTPRRMAQLKARIRENSLEDFQKAFAALERSPFLLGQSASGWKADFDFFLQAKSFTKLLEGSYDH